MGRPKSEEDNHAIPVWWRHQTFVTYFVWHARTIIRDKTPLSSVCFRAFYPVVFLQPLSTHYSTILLAFIFILLAFILILLAFTLILSRFYLHFIMMTFF